MSIKSTLCLSVSTMILASTANAGELSPISIPMLDAKTAGENNLSFKLAAMQFLPDMADSGLGGFSGSIVDDNYGGDEIVLKGCPDGYQTSGCSGSTPFTVSTTRAENGNSCYQCRAFEANDCEKDGFYQKSYWDALKPQAALNLPKESMFAQLFGNIFGFRNAQALVSVPDTEQNLNFQDNYLVDGGGGGGIGGGIGGTNQGTNEDDKIINNKNDGDNTPIINLEECKISSRKVIDKEIGANVYTFNKTDVCKYDGSYIKGEWVASCDATKYKYDSNNCDYILAGNKCGDKWDGCYKCSELYSITNANSCGWPLPGVYEPNQTTVGNTSIAVASCNKTTEGCRYNCLMELKLICDATSHPYTSSNCSYTLGGLSCTSDSGEKRYSTCTNSCAGYNETASTCNGILGGGTCNGKYKTCTACTSPKVANAARTACSCPAEYKHTISSCNGIVSGSACDGKYKICNVPSGGGGGYSFSDYCGPQGSMC